MAFVWYSQNGPSGTGVCGTGGGGLASQGIPNSFIIEFDTWDNGAPFSDIPQDHVSADVNEIYRHQRTDPSQRRKYRGRPGSPHLFLLDPGHQHLCRSIRRNTRVERRL